MKRSAILWIVAGLAISGVCASFARVQAGRKSGVDDVSYSLESRAAIGAHHLCSGLWVVGSVYKRTAEEVLAQDIAPFKDFSCDSSFKYSVDSTRRAVTVSGPSFPVRTAVYNDDQGCSIL